MNHRRRPTRLGVGLLAAMALAIYAVVLEEVAHRVHNLSLGESPPVSTVTWLISIPVGVVLLPLLTGGVALMRTGDGRRALRLAALWFAGLDVAALLVVVLLASNVD